MTTDKLSLSYEEALFVETLAKKNPSQEIIVPNEVIEYIAERTPPDSIYEKLVFFLKRGQIIFFVIDLNQSTQFPKDSTGKHVIRYFDTDSKKNGLCIFNIHVTKSYFNAELKGSIQAQSELILKFYAERVFISPHNKTYHEFAQKKAKALTIHSKMGLYLDEQRQDLLDAAVSAGDQKYLFGLINSYDIRTDTDRIYIQAIYAAIDNLDKIYIETGRDLLAWYRYMLESKVKDKEQWEADAVLPEITSIIKNAVNRNGTKYGSAEVKIKKTLIYMDETTALDAEPLSKYNSNFVFPHYLKKDIKDSIVFMPRCNIELHDTLFRKEHIDIKEEDDSLNSFTKDIETLAFKENKLTENLKTGLVHTDGVIVIRKIIQRAQRIIEQRRACGDKRAVIIGILAPASAGKTTFSETLTYGCKVMGLNTGYVGCDSFLQPGNSFRYDYDECKDTYRNVHIWGPGIYNDVKAYRTIDYLKHGGLAEIPQDDHAKKGTGEVGPNLKVVISDGVFIGMEKELLEIIDIIVCLHITDETRLQGKEDRDNREESTHKNIHLLLDFAEKQFHETGDGIRKLIPERADFIWSRETQELCVRKDTEIQLRIWESLQMSLESRDTGELKELAAKYPIFSKGWLADGISHFSEEKQVILKSLINQWITKTHRAKKVVTLIPVGGRGSRFGPFSWTMLKPFYPLFGKSYFIHTVERAVGMGVPPKDIFLFIEEDMIEPAKLDLKKTGIVLPNENFIPEKYSLINGRNIVVEKASMFAMAAIYIRKLRGEDTVIVTERTDLVLPGRTPEERREIVSELSNAIDSSTTIAALEPTVGILGNPPLPEEKNAIINKKRSADLNKGYILPYAKEDIDPLVEDILSVNKFHEKPKTGEGDSGVETGEEIAGRYIKDGATYNGSYFIFRADYLLNMFSIVRTEDFQQLMQLCQCIGTDDESRITQEVYDYFCSDSDQAFENRKIYLSFEHAMMQILAPVKGEAIPQAGVAAASLGLGIAKNWIGSQGTLKAIWPQEKVKDNYLRAEAYGTVQNAIGSGVLDIEDTVKGCHILLAPTDKATRVHIFGTTNLAIAYEHRKKALIVVPISEAKTVGDITKEVLANAQIAGFAEPGSKTPFFARASAETATVGNNLTHMGNNGFGLILNSDNTIVYSEEGIVCISGLKDMVVMKIEEDGIENIYVYGAEAMEVAGRKLDMILNSKLQDDLVYVFDHDNTLAHANNPLNQPLSDMPLLLGQCIMEGARVCIASAKSLDERNQLMRTANDLISGALKELNCNEIEKSMENFELYLDKTATRYINQGGKLVADNQFHVGINNEQAATVKRILKEVLDIPEERIIDYPGSTQKQFKQTDSWGHLGHAVVYYHPEFNDVVKFLAKRYGWSEDEYLFESNPTDAVNNPTGKKTRRELAELIPRS